VKDFDGKLGRIRMAWLLAAGLGVWLTAAPALASTPFPDWVVQAAADGSLQKYSAETKAVVLLDDTLITVGPDGKATERERQVVKILRPQGRDYADLVAWYRKDKKLNSFHAWSIGPDGHQYTVKDDEVHDQALSASWELYDDVRGKVVHPPGADPGGVVAYEAVRQVENYGEDEHTWRFQGEIPVRRSVFEVDLPAGWKNYTAWLHHDAQKATEAVPNQLRWELKDVPAIDLSDVPMAPSEGAVAGRMVIHYSATDLPTGDARWAAIGDWYQGLASPRTEGPVELNVKAKEVAGGAADFKAKIQNVAGFMQREIRYAAIEIGIGGLQPHSAADVFKYRYGDCKDKATLLIAMLDAVGVRATWVLVDTDRGYVDPALPSRNGNHMIAAIEMPAGYSDPALRAVVTARTGKRYLIFDPTDTYTPIGLVRSELQGSYGVLVLGKESQIVHIPELAPDASVLDRAASFNLDADGTLKGKVTETRSGETGTRYRYLYNAEGEKQQREFMDRRLRNDFSSFTLDSATAENTRDMSKDVVVNFSLTANRYAKPAGDLLLVRPRVIGSHSERINEKPRQFPINLGETGTWRDSIDVTLPAGYTVDDMPEPVNVDVGFASYKSEVKASGATLHYTREYVVKNLDLGPEKYGDVKKLMGIITADENNSAVLKKK
jgi:transglutaminase-like putative cysteine protease